MLKFAEIVYACSDPAESRRIRKGLDAGKLQPLLKRVYTSNLTDEPGAIVRAELFDLVAHLYPDAVVSHRSALVPYEVKDLDAGWHGAIYLTYGYTERVEWPGMTVFLLKGPNALSSDRPMITGFGLRVSSLERALLENLQPSRATDRGRKTLEGAEIARWLRGQLRAHGEGALRKLENESGAIAAQLGMSQEHETLRKLIGRALSSRRRAGRRQSRIRWDLRRRPEPG